MNGVQSRRGAEERVGLHWLRMLALTSDLVRSQERFDELRCSRLTAALQKAWDRYWVLMKRVS